MPHAALRPLTFEDRDRLLVWRNSPDVRAHMYTDQFITPEQHAEWFRQALTDQRRRYWIVELGDRPMGLANLYDIDHLNRRCTLGRYLAEPEARGKGLGSFLEFSLIEHAFSVLNLGKLWSEVLIGNEVAWRLHEQHGFVQEARFRRHVLKNGQWTDVIGLGLLAEEWSARRDLMAERLRKKGFEPLSADPPTALSDQIQ